MNTNEVLNMDNSHDSNKPVEWVEMVVANLVREGFNKHKARELAEHFYSLRLGQPAQQEPVAWLFTNVQSGDIEASTDPYDKQGEREYWHPAPLYTSPPAQRTWVDPNNKTQKQYLPHIGEPVLFCHGGKTYTGKHTGGSFQSEVTNQYFNTWECRWMYLPAAHNIKENT